MRSYIYRFIFGNLTFKHYPWVYLPIGWFLIFLGMALIPFEGQTPWEVAFGTAVTILGCLLLLYAKYVQFKKLRRDGVPLEQFMFYRRFKGLPLD